MRVHFVAIGGSVMHQLAIALSKKGYVVTGSDDEIFEPASGNLRQEGILPERQGWFPEKLDGSIDAVILGMHARADNEELLRAKELDLKIYSFPEYIYQESIEKTRVVVGGSHGKTTTTAMIMHVLRSVGHSFDYLVGAKLDGFPQSVQISDAPVIICEGDEYPASTLERRPKFHFLHPKIAIITGIAWDHINVFPTFENYLQQFTIFISMIPADGVLIYNETDQVLKDLVEQQKPAARLVPYAVPESSITNGKTSVTIDGAKTDLEIFGNHNLLNLNAAYLACKELGVTAINFASGIASFKGASRRMELLFSNNNLNVYRDFAHAPSKVIATIQALSSQFPERRLVTVLELHTFSSLSENFLDEYAGSLNAAQSAAVFYSLHALELKRLPHLPAERVREAFGRTDLKVLTSRDELILWLSAQDFTDTNLLFMSSGNYDGLDLTRVEEYLPKHAL